jgi:hypothetical protein
VVLARSDVSTGGSVVAMVELLVLDGMVLDEMVLGGVVLDEIEVASSPLLLHAVTSSSAANVAAEIREHPHVVMASSCVRPARPARGEGHR